MVSTSVLSPFVRLTKDSRLLHGARPVALDIHRDPRGELGVLDASAMLPFAINRLFYIRPSDPPHTRGNHACSVPQVAMAMAGHVVFDLDNGRDRQSIEMASPSVGLLIAAGVWLQMHDFSPDAVVLVAAPERYAHMRHFDRAQPELIDFA